MCLCALRAESSCILQISQALSHQSLKAEARVRSQDSPYNICDKQSGTGPNFPPSTSVFPGQYHFTNVPYSSACFSYHKEKCLPKQEGCLEYWGTLDRKVFSYFVSLRRVADSAKEN
jgi:hypothetical protein